MNSLIIFPDELNSDGTVAVISSRAPAVQARHSLEQNVRTRVGILGGARGHGVVQEIASDRIVLQVKIDEPPFPRCNTHLIVAVCRPPTIRKVIQAATLSGIQSVSIVRAERTEKSYLEADILEPSSIKHEQILALEQCCDSIAPKISVHPRFKPFLFDHLAPLARSHAVPALGLCADGLAPLEHNLAHYSLADSQQDVYIAIGPELGWNDYERKCFLEIGFNLCSLGLRSLRVEYAAHAAIAQIELLRSLASL